MPFDEELFALSMDFANSPELPKLKERFKGWHICKDHATAAAFGYLAAMEEMKKGPEPCSIYDKVLELVEDDKADPMLRTDQLMTEIYYWLDKHLEEEGYDEKNYIRALISEWFDLYIVRR